MIALSNARFPVFNEETGKIEHEFTNKKLPLIKENMSFNLTIHKVGDQFVLDPSLQEEDVSDYRLSIALADNEGEPRITAMQKGKSGAISEEDMEKILNLIESNFKELNKKVVKLVWS